MKILFISSVPLEYSSSANMRNLALIKGLIEFNCEVDLLAPKGERNSKYYNTLFDSINFRKRIYINLSNVYRKITDESNESIKGKVKKYIKIKLHKIITLFSIYDPRKSLAKNINIEDISNDFDIIISSSDPKSSHLIAEKILMNPKFKDKKWIQYWGDPFLNDINNSTAIPKRIIKKEEERLLGKADKVIYVSPFTLEIQKKTYEKYKEKMMFIPVPYLEEKKYPKVKNSKFIVGYFGDYYTRDRNIIPLYQACKKLNDRVELKIYGNSNLKLGNISNILVNERTNYGEIKLQEEKSDLLVCVLNKKGTQIPGKVFHYCATNKPILLIVDGEKKDMIKSYFKQYDRFFICENNKKDIEESIEYIRNNKKEYAPLRDFNYICIAEKFIKAINNIF